MIKNLELCLVLNFGKQLSFIYILDKLYCLCILFIMDINKIKNK